MSDDRPIATVLAGAAVVWLLCVALLFDCI
jgi:hypothetical protein